MLCCSYLMLQVTRKCWLITRPVSFLSQVLLGSLEQLWTPHRLRILSASWKHFLKTVWCNHWECHRAFLNGFIALGPSEASLFDFFAFCEVERFVWGRGSGVIFWLLHAGGSRCRKWYFEAFILWALVRGSTVVFHILNWLQTSNIPDTLWWRRHFDSGEHCPSYFCIFSTPRSINWHFPTVFALALNHPRL